jgi:hypothetical protein
MELGPGEYFIFTNQDFSSLVTSAEIHRESQPIEFGLQPSYPNPFNPSTQINFNLDQAGWVQLSVYDLLGRKIHVLVEGPLSAGHHDYRFDASTLSSGTYVVRLEQGGKVSSQKITLIK